MTNRLSLLGKVNGGGRGGYGNCGESGGFLLKMRKTPNIQVEGMDTGLENPVDPQSGKTALHGRGLGGACVACEHVSAAADPATAGHSRGPGKWEQGGKFPGRGGKWWEEIFDFVGEMEGGWEFPAFSRGEGPLKCGVRSAESTPSRRRENVMADKLPLTPPRSRRRGRPEGAHRISKHLLRARWLLGLKSMLNPFKTWAKKSSDLSRRRAQ
jgi:hypothetical protein